MYPVMDEPQASHWVWVILQLKRQKHLVGNSAMECTALVLKINFENFSF